MRIGIIGMGWVGSSVAISTLQDGLVRELLLCDVRPELAEGEALDLAHGAAFYPTARVAAAAVEDMADCDAVVISAGRGGHPGESRLDLLGDNAELVGGLGRRLSRLRGLAVIVTNPVDILTRVFRDASDLPAPRVIGTGTMLDTARLREVLGRKLAFEPRSIHAQVVGEHGDSEVVLWTSAVVGGVPLRSLPGWDGASEGAIAAEVRGAAQEIIRRKGATNHAIGLVTAALLRWALRGERRVLTVSRVHDRVAALGGPSEIDGLALSLPTVLGMDGATDVLIPPMDASERTALERSAQALRTACAKLTRAPR